MEPSKFCFKGDTVAILEQGQYLEGFTDPEPGSFAVDFSKPASKLTLVGFPPAKYKMVLNGYWALESKQNVFDFSELQGPPMVDGMLNFNRIDDTRIQCPDTIDLSSCNGVMRFTTKEGDMDQTFMFHSYFVLWNHPTVSFDLEFQNDSKDKGNCKIFINGGMAWDFDVPIGESVIRVKCRNPKQIFSGKANRYLTETINKNSINFSRVCHMRVSTTNCRPITCSALSYIVYRQLDMLKLFA
jgi:hypothetical protein